MRGIVRQRRSQFQSGCLQEISTPRYTLHPQTSECPLPPFAHFSGMILTARLTSASFLAVDCFCSRFAPDTVEFFYAQQLAQDGTGCPRLAGGDTDCVVCAGAPGCGAANGPGADERGQNGGGRRQRGHTVRCAAGRKNRLLAPWQRVDGDRTQRRRQVDRRAHRWRRHRLGAGGGGRGLWSQQPACGRGCCGHGGGRSSPSSDSRPGCDSYKARPDGHAHRGGYCDAHGGAQPDAAADRNGPAADTDRRSDCCSDRGCRPGSYSRRAGSRPRQQRRPDGAQPDRRRRRDWGRTV